MIAHEMSRQECYEFLRKMRFGRLGCALEGQPYVVPIYFAADETHLYCFSTAGQKIDWMRANSRVCVEVDEVVDELNWKSVVVLGRYEELDDGSSCTHHLRDYALGLLQERVTWWEPAYVASLHRNLQDPLNPIFYRIEITQMTGHRGTPDSFEETASQTTTAKSKRWSLRSLFR